MVLERFGLGNVRSGEKAINADIENMPRPSVKFQCLAALVLVLLTSGFGWISGWASPTIILLTSDETPLPSGKMTMEEASWIAGLLPAGGFLGNIFLGMAMKRFGRKLPLISISIPMITSWLLVLLARHFYYLYFARLLHGIVAGGVLVVAPVYLLEISSDCIRGALSSTVLLSSHAAIVLAFIVGNYCSFYTTPVVVICSTVLFVILFSFFPESPMFLMRQNKVTEAEHAIRFYQNIRGKPRDVETLQYEMEKLKSILNDSERKKTDEVSTNWSDFVTGPGGKAMIIGLVLSILNQFSGCVAMQAYTANIFKEAGSALAPNVSAIVVSTIQLVGTVVLVFLVEIKGRKFLYLVSTFGTASGLTVLGVYMMLKSWHYNVEAYNWVPIASFSFGVFSAALAILTLPFTVIGEIFPENIKDSGVTICNTIISFCAFITMKYLPLFTESIGFHNSMFVFAGVCISCAIFIIFKMPETKGKSYEQIQELLK